MDIAAQIAFGRDHSLVATVSQHSYVSGNTADMLGFILGSYLTATANATHCAC